MKRHIQIKREVNNSKIKENLMKEIIQFKLNKKLDSFVDGYKSIGGKRNDFFWKWLAYLSFSSNPGFMLSTVSYKYKKAVAETKFLTIMWISILDDIADKEGDISLLDKISKISQKKNGMVSGDSVAEKKILIFTKKLWSEIIKSIKRFPKYKEFENIFFYDANQLVNSMYYSILINENPELININEFEVYGSHKMGFFIYSDFELMASLKFDKNELGRLREVIWRAQLMGRIGNWATTWQREIKEDDFTSGIWAYALTNKLILPRDLTSKNYNILSLLVEKNKLEDKLFKRWQECYNRILSLKKDFKSINVNDYLNGLEKIFRFHLMSKGLK